MEDLTAALSGARDRVHLLEVQKLCWFLMRTIGEFQMDDPLRLEFAGDKYGPYADKLRHLLKRSSG